MKSSWHSAAARLPGCNKHLPLGPASAQPLLPVEVLGRAMATSTSRLDKSGRHRRFNTNYVIMEQTSHHKKKKSGNQQKAQVVPRNTMWRKSTLQPQSDNPRSPNTASAANDTSTSPNPCFFLSFLPSFLLLPSCLPSFLPLRSNLLDLLLIHVAPNYFSCASPLRQQAAANNQKSFFVVSFQLYSAVCRFQCH